MYKGIFEGQGIEYCPLVKDIILYKGYFSNNYLLLTLKSKMCKKKCNIIVMSPGYQSGKSKLISEITKREYRDITTSGIEIINYQFEYINSKNEIVIYDTPTNERSFYSSSLRYLEKMDIIIYVVDIQEQH